MSHPARPDDSAERVGSAGPDLDITAWIAQLDANERLAERVAQALWADPGVCGTYVEVVVRNGVVVLQGELASDRARAAALRKVWAVTGVREVCDQTQVRSSAKAGADRARGDQ